MVKRVPVFAFIPHAHLLCAERTRAIDGWSPTLGPIQRVLTAGTASGCRAFMPLRQLRIVLAGLPLLQRTNEAIKGCQRSQRGCPRVTTVKKTNSGLCVCSVILKLDTPLTADSCGLLVEMMAVRVRNASVSKLLERSRCNLHSKDCIKADLMASSRVSPNNAPYRVMCARLPPASTDTSNCDTARRTANTSRIDILLMTVITTLECITPV